MTQIIYPGSFDPITNGHIGVLNKGLALFGKVTILVMSNADKKHMFDTSRRVQMINKSITLHNKAENIKVVNYDKWISDYIKEANDNVIIIRGLRNSTDLDYEMMYESFTNQFGAQTVYVSPEPDNIFTSSSLVRNLIQAEGNYLDYVPWRNLP